MKSDPISQNTSSTSVPSTLRTYPAPWRGELVLICGKCTRRLSKHGGSSKLLKLKKWFKTRGKAENGKTYKVVKVDCLKMCPEGGVTVTSQTMLSKVGNEVVILRSEQELEDFYQSLDQPGSAA